MLGAFPKRIFMRRKHFIFKIFCVFDDYCSDSYNGIYCSLMMIKRVKEEYIFVMGSDLLQMLNAKG
jgi:hypothetical protein